MTEENSQCGSNCTCKDLDKKLKKLENDNDKLKLSLRQEKEMVSSLKVELDELDELLKEAEDRNGLSVEELKELRDMLLHSLRNSNNVPWRRTLKRLMASIDRAIGA